MANYLGDAVNAVRKKGHRELLEQGDATRAMTKCVWLQKPNKRKRLRRLLLAQLIRSTLRTARAWNEWISWTKTCRIEPLIRSTSMV
jgi:hypothetical protein